MIVKASMNKDLFLLGGQRELGSDHHLRRVNVDTINYLTLIIDGLERHDLLSRVRIENVQAKCRSSTHNPFNIGFGALDRHF